MDASAIEYGWKTCRSTMRRAERNGDHEAIVTTWETFQGFCDEYGWPDWWQDLERIYNDSMFLEQMDNW